MNNTVTDKIKCGLAKIAASKTAMIISGTVCAVPFVFEWTFLLSWIMYIPLAVLFLEFEKKNPDKTARVLPKVFLFGFAYYVVGYSWLAELYPMDFAGLNEIQSALIIILALTAIPSIHSGMLTLCFGVCRFLSKKAGFAWKVAIFPCVIVLCEYLQSIGDLAFPWCRVHVAQSAVMPILQSASLFGSYFITYIVVLVNVLLASAVFNSRYRKMLLCAAIAVFTINFTYGTVRILLTDKSDNTFTAVALQGNFSSSEKWNGSTDDMLNVYLELSTDALEHTERKNDVIILMPETGLPVTVYKDSEYSRIISDFSVNNDINFAVGAFTYCENSVGNSIIMYTPDGKMSEPYVKRHRVPFGEYIPYRPLFTTLVPSLSEINMLSSDIYEGKDTAVFDTTAGKAGAVICYESIFPEICRQSVYDGAEILLIGTNDSWFGESGALRHHLANASMRAIENDVPVVRAANTGISALINTDGSIVKKLDAGERGYVSGILSKGSGTTLYSHIGDVWLWLCFFAVALSSYKIWLDLFKHLTKKSTL